MRFSRELLETDLYLLLGVSEAAGQHEIRRSYRRLARMSHPDINPNDPAALRRMKLLNVAARVLLDPAERRAYDEMRGRAKASARRQGWYERVSVGPSDWTSPVRSQAAVESSNEFRERPSRTALYLQDWLLAMSNERRLSIAALCLALGWGLISFAHPSNAFWLPPAGQQASAP